MIPMLHSVRLAPLLRAVNVIPFDPVEVRLRPPQPPPLPDTNAQMPKIGFMPLPPKGLHRSQTLVDRDASLDRAVRAAERTLHGHAVARQALEEEMYFVDSWLDRCQQNLETVHAEDACEALSHARQEAIQSLQRISEVIAHAEKGGLDVRIRELATQCQQLRRRTHALVERF